LIAAIAAPFMFGGCYYDNFAEIHPTLADTTCVIGDTVHFDTDIYPILSQNCGGSNDNCHSAASAQASHYNSLTDAYNLLSADDTLGNQTSLWYRITLPISDSNHMPKDLPVLSSCDLRKIAKWLNSSAPHPH